MNAAVKTVVIETPKNSRLKYKFDHQSGLFKVHRVLPLGLHFPFNFGFVPDTQAADGDPADVLLIMDEIVYPGCGVECRFIGVIEAEQTSRGRAYRNDRIIAAAVQDRSAPKTLIELPEEFIPECRALLQHVPWSRRQPVPSVARRQFGRSSSTDRARHSFGGRLGTPTVDIGDSQAGQACEVSLPGAREDRDTRERRGSRVVLSRFPATWMPAWAVAILKLHFDEKMTPGSAEAVCPFLDGR
jgi:inorganic pyrophosphatase